MVGTLQARTTALMQQHPLLLSFRDWLFGCCRKVSSESVLRQRLLGLTQTHLIKHPVERAAVQALLDEK